MEVRTVLVAVGCSQEVEAGPAGEEAGPAVVEEVEIALAVAAAQLLELFPAKPKKFAR